MPVQRPFNLNQWIEENRHLLKPPVGNKQIYIDNKDFIVMIVGGPNARKDYHYNETEELFYQIEGDIVLKIIEDGDKFVDIQIRQGEMFLLPAGVPHSPRRGADTVGLVIEKYRQPGQQDGFLWFCENCNNKLYEEYAEITDIVKQLPVIMNNFFSDEHLRTCQNCGTIMAKPEKK